jgi:pyridoxine 5-phosphate synthase
VHAVRPDQATIVPVTPGEITSHAGWTAARVPPSLRGDIESLKRAGIRVSLFVEPEAASIELAASLGADRVELYTEPFARAFERGDAAARQSYARYVEAAEVAHGAGLGINAGHDLDVDNLLIFRDLPYLDEVSIGHALMSRALFSGLETSVRAFLTVLHGSAGSTAAGGRA